MLTKSTHWIDEEFASLKLGDERLNKRAKTVMERFSAHPAASIPTACRGWSETIATYRFLGNEEVDWREIMAPHYAQTRQRMRGHTVVLCLQDTTELDFKGQDIAGLGPLSYEAQRGKYLHPTYAITPQREPLGVTDAWRWARQLKDADGRRPGAKESLRGIEGYKRVAAMAAEMADTRLVYVADRESDIVVRSRFRDAGGLAGACPTQPLPSRGAEAVVVRASGRAARRNGLHDGLKTRTESTAGSPTALGTTP